MRLLGRRRRPFNDGLSFKGELVITVRGPDGRIKHRRKIHNTVTANGKAGLMDQILAAPTLAKPIQMAVGTGTPAANALGAEAARVAFTSKTRATNVVTFVGDYAAGTGTGSLTEAGIFDAASVGNMWVSTTFAAIPKGATDTLNISWTLTAN